MRSRPTLPLTAVVAAIVALAAVGGSGAQTRRAANPPMPPASQFSARVDNAWFPLVPATRYVYVGVKDGRPSRDVVTVSDRVRRVDGVPCAAVLDRFYVDGRLRERTTDWYSQDRQGNVWYLGEETAELDRNGHVTNTDGTWLAGVDGAQAGVYMPAHPRVGQAFRQEYYEGEAEDHFRVIGVLGTVTGRVAANALLTEEWTPLEPGAIDRKLYARGIGIVSELARKGSTDHAELVSVTRVR